MATRYQRLLEEIRKEFPDFRVVKKSESRFQRLIDRVLRVVTLGGQSSYLTHYQTTIGQTVYVTDDWDALPDEQRYITMRHELVHVRQFRRFGLVPMALLYVVGPLPAGLAWFRAFIEKEGYAETIRACAEVHGLDHVCAPAFRADVIRQFTSGAYGWMWPFRASLERWYDGVITEVRAKL